MRPIPFAIAIAIASLLLCACSDTSSSDPATTDPSSGAQFGTVNDPGGAGTTREPTRPTDPIPTDPISEDVVTPDPVTEAQTTTGDPCGGLHAGDPCVTDDCCHADPVCAPCATDDEPCAPSGMACLGTNPCGDDDPCGDDLCTCVGQAPVCEHPNALDGTPCVADPNACTFGDACLGGQCLAGTPLPLDDGNPCTTDLCVKGEVQNQALIEGPCSDDNACTIGDHCLLGACVSGDLVECAVPTCAGNAQCVPGEGCVTEWLPAGAVCDDGDACTLTAACDEHHLCSPLETVQCDDGDPCTADFCAQGACNATDIPDCAASPETCADESDCQHLAAPCMVPVCVDGACTAWPVPGSCDDGNPDTCADVCTGGICAGSICSTADPGEVCATAIELTNGVPYTADLCAFDDDSAGTWCGATGRDIFFILPMAANPGQFDIDVSVWFPGMMLNYRSFETHVCESGGPGFCWTEPHFGTQPTAVGAGYSYPLSDVLYFMVTSTMNTCGTFTLTATSYPNP